jgi:hypothetical protein
MDGGRVNTYEYLIVLRHRLVDVPVFQDVGREPYVSWTIAFMESSSSAATRIVVSSPAGPATILNPGHAAHLPQLLPTLPVACIP